MTRRRALVAFAGTLATVAAACAPQTAAPAAKTDAKPTAAAAPVAPTSPPAAKTEAKPADTANPTAAPAAQAAPAVPKSVQKVTFGFATKTISPLGMNLIVGQELGYFREEGLEVDYKAVSAQAALAEGTRTGSLNFSVGSPTFLLPLAAKGETFPVTQFYQYTYPFKWDWVVTTDSAIQGIGDLKGKKLGVASFGTVEQAIGRSMLRGVGINGDTDVTWTAVGEGTTGHIAISRGDVDAMIYFDTGLGGWDVAGLKYRVLPRPADVPQVGGFFIQALSTVVKDQRALAVGMGRGTAKGGVFALENPEAGSKVFLKMFPEAGTPSKSEAENIQDIKTVALKRMPLWKSPDPSITKWGFIREKEWLDEVEFQDLKGKVEDVKQFFTNDLIDDINTFDAEAIKKQAREYR